MTKCLGGCFSKTPTFSDAKDGKAKRMEQETIIEMRGISKRFNGLVANNNIDFDLKKGEIHALLGENGAGKTTLMNILSGMYQPDKGEIYVKEKKVKTNSPEESLNLGIGVVYQHLTLVPALSVLENILLGTNKKFLLPEKYAEKRFKEIAEHYGLYVDPDVKIWQLSAGEQQRVEIVKLFYRGSDILILDEPTSVLTPLEIEDFFKVLKSMTKAGKSVVFITHKLEEALRISDRITVLRQGEKAGEIDLKDGTGEKEKEISEQIVKMMFKDKEVKFVEGIKKTPEKTSGEVALTLKGVTAKNDRGFEALRQVSFSLHKGEVLGIAGVDGNGQKELAEVIVGQRKVSSGKITLNESDITNRSVKSINERGLFYVTDDRIGEGCVSNLTLAENAIFRCYKKEPFSKKGILLNRKAIKEYGNELIKNFSIKAPNAEALVGTLSGGNIQKLLLAREFSQKPVVLVCNKPTHGLDVMTTQFIRNEMKMQSKQGVSVLLISSDLDEIMEVSDRIGVLFKGELLDILPNKGTTKEEVGRLMLGLTDKKNNL
ncbi:ABC transporter ATP-binding protein [Patescibacteria group bacterium]|nr:ABC transporter ATP-binding protein [Patescibacteria group bacterium]